MDDFNLTDGERFWCKKRAEAVVMRLDSSIRQVMPTNPWLTIINQALEDAFQVGKRCGVQTHVAQQNFDMRQAQHMDARLTMLAIYKHCRDKALYLASGQDAYAAIGGLASEKIHQLHAEGNRHVFQYGELARFKAESDPLNPSSVDLIPLNTAAKYLKQEYMKKLGTTICAHGTPTDERCDLCT